MNPTSQNTSTSAVRQTALWTPSDTTWTLGLFGTAIGAGVLYFPIKVGLEGMFPMLVMMLLAYPIAFLCHRALARLCLSTDSAASNITEAVERHFGRKGGYIITLLYFFAICPLLWIYGVGLTDTCISFYETELHFAPVNRGIVAFLLLSIMTFIILFGRNIILKIMSYLVLPFIISLILISLALIPYWRPHALAELSHPVTILGQHGLLSAVWGGIAIMVFSFNFSPIVSTFVVAQREIYENKYGKTYVEQKCSHIISRASLLIVSMVLFFTLSCTLTLTPADLQAAKASNISVLSYLANHFITMSAEHASFAKLLTIVAPLIAFVAIFKSFFGHYMGAQEGLNALLAKLALRGGKDKLPVKKINFISMILIMVSTWIVAYMNPDILDLIAILGAPIIAAILCILPISAIYCSSLLSRYRYRLDNYFVAFVGILTILNIVTELF